MTQDSVNYAEFNALTDRYFAAWSSDSGLLDINVPAQLYAKDPELVFYDIAPPLEGYLGWDAFASHISQNLYDRFTRFQVQGKDDLRLYCEGNFVVACRSFGVDAELKNGQSVKLEGRMSWIWEERDSDWQIVHEHASVPLQIGWTVADEAGDSTAVSSQPRNLNDEFQKFHDEYFAAWAEHFDRAKADVPAKFYAIDPGLVIYDPAGKQPFTTYSELSEHLQNSYKSLSRFLFHSNNDLRVWHRGNFAWITFTFATDLTPKEGQQTRFVGRQTNVLVKRDDNWVIIHEHPSIPISSSHQ